MDNQLNQANNKSNIGTILVSAGKIKSIDIDRILAFQQQKNVRFGEAAKALNLIKDEDIEYALAIQFGYPVLLQDDQSVDKSIFMAFKPNSEAAENIRSIREYLNLHWFNQHKELIIVSQSTTDSASIVLANLAVAYAQLGKRTLVIDADLINPKQHEYFKTENRYGLVDLLANRYIFKEVLRPTTIDNLFILSSGAQPPNTYELISRSLKDLLQNIGAEFDVILIDTTAFDYGLEAKVVASIIQGSIIVAKQNESKVSDVEYIKQNLLSVECECLGAILNN